jgi:hypothetical protein
MNDRSRYLNNSHDQSPDTDISPSEIDAFDAYLNELSDGERFPNTWSRSRHERPQDRLEPRGTSHASESLATIAGEFQEQVDTAHDLRFGASAPRSDLWETIMLAHTIPASGSVTTTASWSDPQPAPSSQRANLIRSTKSRTPRWSAFVNIALVLAILLAGYSVWSNRGGFGGDGDGDDNNGIAWQPQTPTNEIAAISSPEATSDAATCPLPPANEGDVDEFTDYEGVITDMVNCVGLFEWPEGFEPDFDKIRAYNADFEGRIQRGAGVGSLMGFNECAWSITWLEARASGDLELEALALDNLSQLDRENLDPGSREYKERQLELARTDDSSMIEQFVGVNCYPLWWTSYEGTPPAGEQVSPTVVDIATPDSTSTCDLTADLPIFSHTADVEFEGTALRLNEDGQLILSCAADPDGTVVASNVTAVSPFDWPGMVTITLDAIQVDQPRLAVLDLATGKIVEVGHRPGSMQLDMFHELDSPWVVAPALDNPQDWSITDLRTMETRLLSEYTGGTLPFEVSLLTSSNGSAGSIAIAVADPENELQYTVIPNDSELPGAVLILDDSFEASRWIPTPEFTVGLTNPMLTPDGEYLAFKTGFSDDDPGADSTYVIVQTSDGAIVAESPLSDDPDSNALWASDSSGLLFAQGPTLSLLSVTPGQEPKVLFEQPTPGELGNLKSTYDPDVFLVDRTMTEDLVDEVAAGIEQHVYSVNVVTGEVITFDGWDASANTWPPETDTRFLVMYEPVLPATETTTYHVFDAVTGEAIGTPFEAPNVLSEQFSLQPTSVTSTEDGRVEVFGFNSQSVYLMQTVNGVDDVTLMPPLPGDESLPVGLELSPDGSYLSLRTQVDGTSAYWLLDLEADTASWIEVAADGDTTSYYMRFVEGTEN